MIKAPNPEVPVEVQAYIREENDHWHLHLPGGWAVDIFKIGTVVVSKRIGPIDYIQEIANIGKLVK